MQKELNIVQLNDYFRSGRNVIGFSFENQNDPIGDCISLCFKATSVDVRIPESRIYLKDICGNFVCISGIRYAMLNSGEYAIGDVIVLFCFDKNTLHTVHYTLVAS